jgi:hypothetical protein
MMVKELFFLSLVLLQSLAMSGQSRWGVECRYAHHLSKNVKNLYTVPAKKPQSYTIIDYFAQRPLWSSGYSLGVIYERHRMHRFKLHVGQHVSGISVDVKFSYLPDGGHQYSGFPNQYISYQINPSYTFSLHRGAWKIPIEIGINLNTCMDNGVLVIGYPKKVGYDARIALGLGYSISEHFSLSTNFVYMRALHNYVDQRYSEDQFYYPQLIGGELSIAYMF